MNKLIIKDIVKKVMEFLIYGPGYKAPEYAYVRLTQPSDKDPYKNTYQR